MAQTVCVIDYGSGNLRSVAKSLERVAAEADLGGRIVVSGQTKDVLAADHVVLPGVGAFGDCYAGLSAIDGMVEAITEVAINKARPFLGICVGMQLMAEIGLEHGRHTGFGWFEGQVEPIKPRDPALKVPHMGWNALELTGQGQGHPLFAGIKAGDHAYFVHSYHMALASDRDLLAQVHHGAALTAAIGRDTLVGVQFHPEKSQKTGLKLLHNFLEWQP
ncbi:imidazole glycerol phosphate synthase subunit HisH [Iodidimonas muriae]|uniref:Imidazole glycerol phosphate synthase subunit HisH n=1 Tax=Iodidimonas muriae TaxID=261467 RepID=A0ABQ2L9A7_9PROT|nr:imidazole glycerol phosphate synthase subunit HisH [Iodidimonas muriae]GGO07525.1 imidazole glycerol phosphate synthase subunit HisH [Iodidimonas muriae]